MSENTTEIYGQQVPIPEVPDGDTVLDVIVVVRAVNVNDAGQMGDATYSTTSDGATFTSAIGMLQRQLWEMEEIARQAIGDDNE